MSGEPPAILARPRAVLFDWDNTLVDSWGVIHGAINATQVAMGHVPWTFDETRTKVRASARDAFPKMFGDRWEEAQRIFYDTFRASHLERLRAMPGAADLLAALGDAGVYLGVVSNKQGGYLRAEAEHLGWSRHFGRLVGATDAPRDKPAVDPVDMALAGSGIPRGPDVWFVGDADIDLACALNAGCVPVLLRGDPPGEGEFPDAPPARHLADCLAFAALVAKFR
jgi:phosphoglycolate phosphatase